MGKRFNSRQRNALREQLHGEQAGKCALCGREIVMHPADLDRRHYDPLSPEIDHIDNDRTNNAFSNLQKVHKRCNAIKGNLARGKRGSYNGRGQPNSRRAIAGISDRVQVQAESRAPLGSSALERKRGREEGRARVPGPKERRRFAEISPWLQGILGRECWQGSALTSKIYLEKFAEWIVQAFGEDDRLRLDRELFVSGAAVIWISEEVLEKYLKRWISDQGFLKLVLEGRDRWLVWRSELRVVES